jgi:hypothetical protein
MAISRNPDDRPQIDPAKDEEARKVGLKRIQLICDTPEDEPDDPETPPVTVIAYSDFIPRKGETIVLQDGKRVLVQDVFYRFFCAGQTQYTALSAIVYATLRRD